ncbi:MAG: 50S ribosomal protein L10 [Pirellulales bacterium]|nr:50S ribosomal protein L10 [Pirellulales bacterium]
MSKYVKNLISEHLRQRLTGVQDALLVNVIGLSANNNHRIRTELASKNIHVLVIKNSMATRAFTETALAPMFDGLTGTAALCWGGEDIVSLAKEVARIAGDEKNKPFEPRGGVMDGQRLSAAQVAEVAKWPSRAEQLRILVGQILSPGATLVGQLEAAGGALASQIKKKAETEEEGDAA